MLPILLNATLGMEGWLKSKFYPHLSENRVGVNNANKQLRISAKVQPSLSAVDLMFFKPQSNTLFRELPLSDTTNVVFPISAKSSLIERLIDNTISDGFSRRPFSKYFSAAHTLRKNVNLTLLIIF
jgi:hypothetical protein